MRMKGCRQALKEGLSATAPGRINQLQEIVRQDLWNYADIALTWPGFNAARVRNPVERRGRLSCPVRTESAGDVSPNSSECPYV
jgi:hypothetical protein